VKAKYGRGFENWVDGGHIHSIGRGLKFQEEELGKRPKLKKNG
jgi:hypothetical protein